MVRNYSAVTKDRWIPAKVLEQTGPVSFKCELEGGKTVRRHQNQILTRSTNLNRTLSPSKNMPLAHIPSVSGGDGEVEGDSEREARLEQATLVRRSARVVKPPDRLDLYGGGV